MSPLLTPQEKLIIPHFVLLKHSPYTLIIVHSQNRLLYLLSDCVWLSLYDKIPEFRGRGSRLPQCPHLPNTGPAASLTCHIHLRSE